MYFLALEFRISKLKGNTSLSHFIHFTKIPQPSSTFKMDCPKSNYIANEDKERRTAPLFRPESTYSCAATTSSRG